MLIPTTMMIPTNDLSPKEQLKTKILKGDYVLLAKMMGTERDAARMRFRRNNKDAIFAMQLIVKTREDLIASYNKSLNT